MFDSLSSGRVQAKISKSNAGGERSTDEWGRDKWGEWRRLASLQVRARCVAGLTENDKVVDSQLVNR